MAHKLRLIKLISSKEDKGVIMVLKDEADKTVKKDEEGILRLAVQGYEFENMSVDIENNEIKIPEDIPESVGIIHRIKVVKVIKSSKDNGQDIGVAIVENSKWGMEAYSLDEIKKFDTLDNYKIERVGGNRVKTLDNIADVFTEEMINLRSCSGCAQITLGDILIKEYGKEGVMRYMMYCEEEIEWGMLGVEDEKLRKQYEGIKKILEFCKYYIEISI